jgi:Zn-dependent protease
MALRLGDDTAASLGRITLNPLAHIDPFGTVLMPLLQIFGGLPVIGWAKPTPYDPRRFRREVSMRQGHISVAGAGPISNLILALAFAVVFAIVLRIDIPEGMMEGIYNVMKVGIGLNVALAVFNLLPIPPLDGSHMLSWSLPRALGEKFDHLAESYGTMILWILFLTGLLGWLIGPIQRVVTLFIFRLIQ